MSGDTAVVGALGDDDNGDDSGSAYVFTRTGTAWTQQAKLTASDGVGGDNFGVSVAVSGDTVVVGAPYDDDSGDDSGSAYVYSPYANQPPSANAGEPYLVAAGSSITLKGTAYDPDGDLLSYLWTAEAGYFNDETLEDSTYTAGTETGIFDLTFTATDPGGLSATAATFVVVYAPDDGFVTGGGWIDSSEGACQLTETCQDATGEASFGFVSKYKKGASVPEGNTVSSTSWLVA